MSSDQRFESIEGEDLYRRLATDKSILVLDVRTPTEFDEAHIPGSVLIPLQDLEQRVREVPNSGMPIAVVCEHGLRSVSACRLLAEHGGLAQGQADEPPARRTRFLTSGEPERLAGLLDLLLCVRGEAQGIQWRDVAPVA